MAEKKAEIKTTNNVNDKNLMTRIENFNKTWKRLQKYINPITGHHFLWFN